ncbi:alpha/beta hydrolase family protein [Candidatus Neomarinimicrobiota bacterium]
MKTIFRICLILILQITFSKTFAQIHTPASLNATSNILTNERVEQLLVRPICLDYYDNIETWENTKDFRVESDRIFISAELYLPYGDGPWPTIILIPGGFNNTEEIMMSPRFEAPRLARCGYAATVYYKRGTGLSGGSYAEATYDDFINDVGSIAKYLVNEDKIDPKRIGVSGGSQGGIVGSIAAARFDEISFVINKSGPIVPMVEENDYNIANALKIRGYSDSLITEVLPLWKRHHSAWSSNDSLALEDIAKEIRTKRKICDPFLLPTPYDEVFQDSNLVFMWPVFRSASKDFLSEMKNMSKKYLSIYGELDPIVPAKSCINNIEKLMKESHNENVDIVLLKGVGHSFEDQKTQRYIPVIRIVINWLKENI